MELELKLDHNCGIRDVHRENLGIIMKEILSQLTLLLASLQKPSIPKEEEKKIEAVPHVFRANPPFSRMKDSAAKKQAFFVITAQLDFFV